MTESQRQVISGEKPIAQFNWRMNALTTPLEDPSLEAARRRANTAMIAFVVTVPFSVPFGLIFDSLLRRIGDGRIAPSTLLFTVGPCLIAVFWIAYGVRHRRAESRLPLLKSIVGVGVAVLLEGVYLAFGFARV
jgi:hypothetical protein